ncbi:MAG: hypothetical protein ACI923_002749 [Flavobacteriales bacterium]
MLRLEYALDSYYSVATSFARGLVGYKRAQ